MKPELDISVVVPLFNEEESLPELFDWIARVMHANKFSYEVIFVNDGSTDKSWDVIVALAAKHPEAKGIRFRKNQGKSNGLNVGFKAATGDVVITGDIPLASKCVAAGARVLKHNGEALTQANIGNVLATRDLMADLRAADPFRQGGGKGFTKADRSRFLEALERELRAAARQP